MGGLSFTLLTLGGFYPTQLPLAQVAEGLLCSSTMTAIISVILSTMLQFTFEGRETATRKDLVIAWSPVLLLDLCIGEYLLALVFWYSGDVGIFRGYGSSCPSNKATALVIRNRG